MHNFSRSNAQLQQVGYTTLVGRMHNFNRSDAQLLQVGCTILAGTIHWLRLPPIISPSLSGTVKKILFCGSEISVSGRMGINYHLFNEQSHSLHLFSLYQTIVYKVRLQCVQRVFFHVNILNYCCLHQLFISNEKHNLIFGTVGKL